MRKLVGVWCCLLCVCSSAGAQALKSRVPADAIAYYAWAGADSPGNGYSGSRLEAVVEEHIKRFAFREELTFAWTPAPR